MRPFQTKVWVKEKSRVYPKPSIMTGDVGGRLAVPFLRAVGPRVGQALPLHRAGVARLGEGAHDRAPARRSPDHRRIRAELRGSRQK